MMTDLADNENLSGVGQGHVRLTGRGATSDEVMSSLKGVGYLVYRDQREKATAQRLVREKDYRENNWVSPEDLREGIAKLVAATG